MRLLDDKKDENENTLEEGSVGEKSKEVEKFVETSNDAKSDEAALKVPSVGASSFGIRKPKGVLAKKKKIVKKVKRLVKKKSLIGTTVQVAGEENVTVEQGVKEGISAVNTEKDERSAEPSLGESGKEVKKVVESVADSSQHSPGKDNDSETSIGGNDTESKKEVEESAEVSQPADEDDEKVAGSKPKETLKEVKGKETILKSVGKRLQKGKKVKGTLSQGIEKDNATILQGPEEGVDLDLIVSDKRDSGASPGGNVREKEKTIESSVGEAAGTPVVNTDDDINKHHNVVETLNLEVNTSGGGEHKILAEKNKRKEIAEDKTDLSEDKRQGKQVLGSNKKHKKEVVAAEDDVKPKKMEEGKDQLVKTEKKDGHEKAKIGGLIFMCNAKTKPDCFRFNVMGVKEKKKDYVMSIKPGLKLFLYDYDLKLLYGIFQASSAGGMKLERNAFGGSFPAQVRFKVIRNCIPLPESKFKKAIKENYDNRNKFKTELTYKQVFKLKKLFRPATLPAQLTHTAPIPVRPDADRKRSNKDRYAPGSSRTHPTRTHERSRNAAHAYLPPRREEPPRDLYLTEREYRAYGLKREETSRHFQIPPMDSSYHIVGLDRVPLDSYHPSVDHDRLLRHAESVNHDRLLRHAESLDHARLLRHAESVDHDRLLRQAELERLDRREARLALPEREYRPYDHLTSRREILPRNIPEQPADSYRRDLYHRYENRSPERPPRQAYLPSSGRKDDDLYSRYVTADSLAEYYGPSSSARRYPSVAESELPPLLVSTRYGYSGGSLPYSHR